MKFTAPIDFVTLANISIGTVTRIEEPVDGSMKLMTDQMFEITLDPDEADMVRRNVIAQVVDLNS